MIHIKELLKGMEQKRVSNGEYYNLSAFYNILICQLDKAIVLEDMILTPYYIDQEKVYELYDYELNVRVVKQVDVDAYFLSKTGKNTIAEIDKNILHKLAKCYIEVTENEEAVFKDRMVEYLNYILNSEELKNHILKIYNTFDKSKLYFEFY